MKRGVGNGTDRLAVLVSRVLRRLMITLNPLNSFILAGGLHPLASRGLMLLNFRGRVSKRSFTTPVSYVQMDDDLLVPAGGSWWKNLASGPVGVRLRGTWWSVTPTVIGEPAALSTILGRMIALRRAVSIFTGIRVGPDGLPTPASVERERKRGLVVVRLHLERMRSAADAAA